ncbi:hypothetical protein AB670_03936 [Chryseobacterium sp. MOF25P]|nr:hypothetical protein AB670_03936 [Chryseobacterium sp. MOF25P]OBW43630.1 hypothetical protein AB671_04289 [Chryseobacterium sp. BGARF1]
MTFSITLTHAARMLPRNLSMRKSKTLECDSEASRINLSFYSDYPRFLLSPQLLRLSQQNYLLLIHSLSFEQKKSLIQIHV